MSFVVQSPLNGSKRILTHIKVCQKSAKSLLKYNKVYLDWQSIDLLQMWSDRYGHENYLQKIYTRAHKLILIWMSKRWWRWSLDGNPSGLQWTLAAFGSNVEIWQVSQSLLKTSQEFEENRIESKPTGSKLSS